MKHKKGTKYPEIVNGKKIMWMMVMFDLPTETSVERKKAARFRIFLQEKGFSMSQYSVYIRFTGTQESSQKYVRMVKANSPDTGDICILFFTDYQFGNIIRIQNSSVKKMKDDNPTPVQLMLF